MSELGPAQVFTGGMATGGFLTLMVILAEIKWTEWRKRWRDKR